jgi:thymidylate synthase (FAD)
MSKIDKAKLYTDYPDDFHEYLDHGYVMLVDKMGKDERIAAAARQSFAEREYSSPQRNAGLIDYLFYHEHSTPIEMAVMMFESRMPIFVARQHVRHRMQTINELSLRYVKHDGLFYVPPLERMQYQPDNVKQGASGQMPAEVGLAVQQMIREESERQYKTYLKLVREEEEIIDGKPKMVCKGLAKELSRAVLGTNFYTQMSWKMDLRNLANYLRLRLDPHAQWEIREHARLVNEIVLKHYPMTVKAMTENVLESVKLSKTEANIVRTIMSDSSWVLDTKTLDAMGLNKSRHESFRAKLGLGA